MPCWFCGGSGSWTRTRVCNDCNGKRTLAKTDGRRERCFNCGGRGEIRFRTPCPVCSQSDAAPCGRRGLRSIKLDEKVHCTACQEEVTVEECMQRYVDATAFAKRDRPCCNCKQGREVRERYAHGQEEASSAT